MRQTRIETRPARFLPCGCHASRAAGLRIPLALLLSVAGALSAQAQQDETASAPESRNPIEEVVVTGERSHLQLRLQMTEAEQAAYEIFNQFNDEKRFHISCSTQTPTGSRIQSDEQYCQPNFEIEANRAHARDSLESFRLLYDPYSTDKNAVQASQPAALVIASQQRAYQRKMKEVAEQHPEFLQAIIRFTEIKTRYEEAVKYSLEEAVE